MGMTRQEAIAHLENMKWLKGYDNTKVGGVPLTDIIDNIIALLKAQETRNTFRVIDRETGKEADTYEIALHEDWAKGLCYCDMEGFAVEEDGTLLLIDECGRFEYADRDRFEVKWDG